MDVGESVAGWFGVWMPRRSWRWTRERVAWEARRRQDGTGSCQQKGRGRPGWGQETDDGVGCVACGACELVEAELDAVVDVGRGNRQLSSLECSGPTCSGAHSPRHGIP